MVQELSRCRKHCVNPIDSVLKSIKGGGFRDVLECDTHIPIVIEWVLNAGRLNDPTTFRSSLLINSVRVRGIDFHEFAQRRYYKQISPAGWHQDIIDPNQGLRRKDPIDIGTLTGIRDFVLRAAREWNIEIESEEGLL